MIRPKPIWRSMAVLAAGCLAVTGCSSDNGGSSSNGGGKTVTIASDLPLQGASADSTKAMNDAIKLYLEQIGNKAGKHTIKFKTYDDSTAATGKWDDATCAKNAQAHVENTDEVAVMGTFNSGCAKQLIPVLNQAPDGPMLMVSHANTNPGLTKKWDPQEPEKYYPANTRNYARVITTDDFQGTADSTYLAKDLAKKRCFVLNDNETYGKGVAQSFIDNAGKVGLTILGNQSWDKKAPNYDSLFQSIKTKNPDCIFLGGIFDNNGGKLVRDKIKILGDNKKILMMAPDGFTGYPALQKDPNAEGMYLSFAGLDTESLRKNGGAAAKFLDAYKKKYGTDPPTSYALYAVAAVQVIIDAIAKSDGTRKSVTDAVFGGSGISIPADKAVIGKEIKIDPKTGDTNNIDISILQMTSGREKFVKAQPVG